MGTPYFWSEWRDLNSRPLDPQSSALPTAPHPDAIAGDIIARGFVKCKHYFHLFEKFFVFSVFGGDFSCIGRFFVVYYPRKWGHMGPAHHIPYR